MGLLKSKKKIIIAIIVLSIIMLIILLSPNGAIYKAISNRYKETEQEMDAKINFTSEITSRVTATSAKVNVGITSDIDIDRVIFENDDGTLTEEIVNGKTLTKEITITADKKYVVSIVTTDGKVTRKNILKTKDMIPVKIEATNFGDYIDYPIDLNGNGKTTDDWKIFYVADGNAEGEQAGGAYEDNIGDVYIIAADYLKNTDSRLKLSSMGTVTKNGEYNIYWASASALPVTVQVTGTETLTIAGRKNKSTTINKLFMQNKFGALNSNDNCKAVSTLINTANWTDYVNNLYADYVIGTPTLEMWVASWNTVYGNKLKLYTNKNSYGYYVGTGSNSTTNTNQYITQVDEGYKNALYFPYRTAIDSSRCYGTWLTSPSALSNHGLMYVYCGGFVDGNFYGNGIFGVRPLVHLKSGIKLKQNETTGVWEKQE